MSGENSNKPENGENLDLVREVVAMNRNLLDYLLNGRSSSESTSLMNLFNTQMGKEIKDLRDVIIELREQINRNQEHHAKDINDILNLLHQNRSINQTVERSQTSTSSSSQTEVKSQTTATQTVELLKATSTKSAQTEVKLQKTADTQTEIEPESPNIPTTSNSTDTESTPSQEASPSTSTSKRPDSPSSSLPDLDLSVSDTPYIKVESIEHQYEEEMVLTNLPKTPPQPVKFEYDETESSEDEETGNFKRRRKTNFKRRRVSYNLRNRSNCDEMDIKIQPNQDNRVLVDQGQIRLPYASENASIENGLRTERLKIIYSVIQRYRKVENSLGLSAYTVRNFRIPKRAKYSVYFYCYAKSSFQCPVKLIFEYYWETQKYELYRVGSHTHFLNYQNNSMALRRWEKRLEKDEKASVLN